VAGRGVAWGSGGPGCDEPKRGGEEEWEGAGGPRPKGGTPINPTTKTSQTTAPQRECNRLKGSKTHNDRCRRNRETSNEGTRMRRPSKVVQKLENNQMERRDGESSPPPRTSRSAAHPCPAGGSPHETAPIGGAVVRWVYRSESGVGRRPRGFTQRRSQWN